MEQESPPTQQPEKQNSANITALKLRSVNKLSNISMIASPVSIFIGGVFLSSFALIIAIVATIKANRILQEIKNGNGYAKLLRNRALLCLGVSIVALGLNIYALITLMPLITEIINGENLNDVIESLKNSASSFSSGQTDTLKPDNSGNNSVFG